MEVVLHAQVWMTTEVAVIQVKWRIAFCVFFYSFKFCPFLWKKTQTSKCIRCCFSWTAESPIPTTNPPTQEPATNPTAAPTGEPTHNPTALPIDNPTAVPTSEPSDYPTESPTAPFICPSACGLDPYTCACDDISDGCQLYDYDIGCIYCRDGYFRINAYYPCSNCQSVFGNECVSCYDGQGCTRCAPGYELARDKDCNLHYCRPWDSRSIPTSTAPSCPLECENSPCGCDEVSNCQHCFEHSGCIQCQNGYFKPNDNQDCSHCQTHAGSGCLLWTMCWWIYKSLWCWL